jgi:hypothetical protein
MRMMCGTIILLTESGLASPMPVKVPLAVSTTALAMAVCLFSSVGAWRCQGPPKLPTVSPGKIPKVGSADRAVFLRPVA